VPTPTSPPRKKQTAEAPAKLKEKETLFAEAQQGAVAKKAALDAAQAVADEKNKAFKAMTAEAPKPAGRTQYRRPREKLADLNAENVKVRAERATKTAGTPEYEAINVRVQSIKLNSPPRKLRSTPRKAARQRRTAPDTQTALAEVAKAKDGLNLAKAEAKPADVKLASAEKALAALRKEVDAATQLAAQLRKDLPNIEKTALAAKAQAEQAAQAAAREVAAAKAEAEKRRAAYEALKAGTPKSAAFTPPLRSFSAKLGILRSGLQGGWRERRVRISGRRVSALSISAAVVFFADGETGGGLRDFGCDTHREEDM